MEHFGDRLIGTTRDTSGRVGQAGPLLNGTSCVLRPHSNGGALEQLSFLPHELVIISQQRRAIIENRVLKYSPNIFHDLLA
jgi:hypothetical protein